MKKVTSIKRQPEAASSVGNVWPKTKDNVYMAVAPTLSPPDAVLYDLSSETPRHRVAFFNRPYYFFGKISALRDGVPTLVVTTPDAGAVDRQLQPCRRITFFATYYPSRELVRMSGRLEPALPAVQPKTTTPAPRSLGTPVIPLTKTNEADATTNDAPTNAITVKDAGATARTKFYADLEKVRAEKAAGHDPLVSMKFFAAFANCSVATLYRDRKNGVFTSILVGGRSRVRFCDCEAYVSGESHQRQKAKATANASEKELTT